VLLLDIFVSYLDLTYNNVDSGLYGDSLIQLSNEIHYQCH
jgi:hypothetical protein